MYVLHSSAALLKRLVGIHARTSDCLELASIVDEIDTRDMKANLEWFRVAIASSERDKELHSYISGMLDIHKDYLVESQAILNGMLDYGEEQGCYPSRR